MKLLFRGGINLSKVAVHLLNTVQFETFRVVF